MSYIQHDERGSAGQGGRSFSRRGTTERRWWRDPKEQSGDRESDKGGSNDMRQKDEKTQSKGEDKSVWHHDGFFQLEAEAPPQAKKRPAFREKKMPPDSGAEGIKPAESVRPSRPDRPVSGSENREERGGRHFRDMDRDERPLTGDRAQPYRSEVQRSGIPPRERFSGGSGFRGRDRYSGRHGEQKQYRHNTYRVEKWKHDLFDEANRSPTPKNEEDQIAKVEALLAL
uniref:Btz domain-containing protein n=1 Tax=Nelumbo nucifera TaxID=4432 RepID=A0A822ZAC1_NELNU|nr:TPA_asm: hypothetical protein HUJ06_015823 [Nelumbo nucifera]